MRDIMTFFDLIKQTNVLLDNLDYIGVDVNLIRNCIQTNIDQCYTILQSNYNNDNYHKLHNLFSDLVQNVNLIFKILDYGY